MLKSRREAIDEFLAFVGEVGDEQARNLAERALSRSVEAIWLKHHWRDFESPVPLQMVLVPPNRSYTLPDFFGAIGRGVVRNLTRASELYPIDTTEAQHRFPAAGTTLEIAGDPEFYEIGGTMGVVRQPLITGSPIEAFSSSTLDTNVRVSVEGADVTGAHLRSEATLSGTLPIPLGTFSYIDSVGKSVIAGTEPTTELTSSIGTVRFRVTSGPTIQTLFPEESAREHRLITFYPKPANADLIAVPLFRRPKRLLYDADPLPNDWWNAVWEDLIISWRTNTGELPLDANVPRPHLLDLIAADNMNGPQRRVKPWGGR